MHLFNRNTQQRKGGSPDGSTHKSHNVSNAMLLKLSGWVFIPNCPAFIQYLVYWCYCTKSRLSIMYVVSGKFVWSCHTIYNSLVFILLSSHLILIWFFYFFMAIWSLSIRQLNGFFLLYVWLSISSLYLFIYSPCHCKIIFTRN